jgi:hypothetical protein
VTCRPDDGTRRVRVDSGDGRGARWGQGVRSALFAHERASDAENNAALLAALDAAHTESGNPVAEVLGADETRRRPGDDGLPGGKPALVEAENRGGALGETHLPPGRPDFVSRETLSSSRGESAYLYGTMSSPHWETTGLLEINGPLPHGRVHLCRWERISRPRGESANRLHKALSPQWVRQPLVSGERPLPNA